jgi:hypothetical protein
MIDCRPYWIELTWIGHEMIEINHKFPTFILSDHASYALTSMMTKMHLISPDHVKPDIA